MILDLEDGRELQLPDEMPDETARQLKRWILTLEERARAAESEARILRDELASLRKKVEPARTAADDNREVDAIRELQTALERGIERLVRAQLADTVLVADSISGEPRGSKKVLR